MVRAHVFREENKRAAESLGFGINCRNNECVVYSSDSSVVAVENVNNPQHPQYYVRMLRQGSATVFIQINGVTVIETLYRVGN